MKRLVTSPTFLPTFGSLGGWLGTLDKDRKTLEQEYAGSPSQFVDVAGIRLHVRATGSKDRPVVILLHGFGSSLHTWESWALALSQSYRVVRFDLPGSGLTGPDPTGDYSDERSLEVLIALMDQLGIQRATLVGNSLGGRIAWKFAAAHPARVLKLVLISPDGFASPGFQYGKKPEVPAILRLMCYVLPKPIIRLSLAPAYANSHGLSDDVVTRYHDMMLAPGVRNAMLVRMEQTILQDPLPQLRRIRAPTLLLWGEKDAMIPFSNAADYVNALRKGTKLVPLPQLGHVPHEEAPERSLAPVLAFLNK